jgi:hypothetical protein
MNKKMMFSLCALMFSSTAAYAGDTLPFYEGFGVGTVNYDLNLTDAERHLPFHNAAGQSISTDTYHFDTSDTAYQFFGGYRFNPYLSLELTLAKLGTMHRDGTFDVPSGSLKGTVVSHTRFQPRGVGLSVLGIWPINEHFDLFGRAGIFDWSIKAPYTIDLNGTLIAKDNPGEHGNDPFFGVGGAYKWNEYSVRVEYQRYNFQKPFTSTNDTQANTFNVSFAYGF